MRADYHTHTMLCGHAEGLPVDYVASAIRHGLSEIGISDHAPYPENIDTEVRMAPAQWTHYRQWIAQARELGEGRIAVRYGVEIDWFPGRMQETEQLIADEPFDYVIGSVHYINGEVFDNPYDLSIWTPSGAPDRIWIAYMEEMCRLAGSGCANIIGHFDLPKKFGYFPTPKAVAEVDERAREALRIAAENGVCIEINTSGWSRAVKECYPAEKYLRMGAEFGIGLVLGSDAHTPSQVGARFDDAVALAQSCGFTHLTRFEERRQTRIPLA